MQNYGGTITWSVICVDGHEYTAAVTEPTCTEKGYTTYTCSKCGAVNVSDYVDANGHDYDEWYQTKAPKEYEDGESRRDCRDCEHYETEVIDNNPFTDVPENKYYYSPVLWAYYRGITSGETTTRFGANNPCTREQIVTFLWRAAGSPEATISEAPFTDVSSNKYYYMAVLWAYENEITSGTTATTFGVGQPCTREQVVTFLWKAAGSPEHTIESAPFADVNSSKYYYNAVLWAYENEITSGTTATTFGVGATCTRAQIVTFLHGLYADSKKCVNGGDHVWENWTVTVEATWAETGEQKRACTVCGMIETEIIPIREMTAEEKQQEVLRLVNIERENAGLEPLTYYYSGQAAADIRASEISTYFSHERPNGTMFWEALRDQGVMFPSVAENIAAGYETPESVVEGWMNSEGHRANILDPTYTFIIVGVTQDNYWVQLFLGSSFVS